MSDFENEIETHPAERRPIPEGREVVSDDKAEAEEITQEMIDAGALALAKFTSFYNTSEEGALSVYAAMIAAKTGASSAQQIAHLSKSLKLR